MATGAELTYQTSATALQMANSIFGDGVTVTGASYSGPTNSKAIYSNGQLSPGVVPGTTGVILSTGNAADFTHSSGDPNRSTGTSTNTAGTDNNALFNALAGTNTFDAVWLNVDFIPTSNVMTMRFVLASEEYPEYADHLAELLFGETEVLVAAKDLVNDRTVRVQAGGVVDYVHLMFDRHQVVFAEGLAAESFLPGSQTDKCFAAPVVAELYSLFPQLDPETGRGYGPSARRILRGFEAQVLLADSQLA